MPKSPPYLPQSPPSSSLVHTEKVEKKREDDEEREKEVIGSILGKIGHREGQISPFGPRPKS